MDNKLIMISIAAVIGIIVLGSVLMPILDDATVTTDTFTNNGTRMSPVGDSEITISYSSGTWTINGATYPVAEFPITQGTIMFYGLNYNGGRVALSYYNNLVNETYNRYNVNSDDQVTIIYDGSTKTADVTTVLGSNGQTYQSTYEYIGDVYYYDPNGSYVWSGEKPTPAYIPDDWNDFNAWSVGSDHFYAIIGDTIMVDGEILTEGATATLTTSNVDGHIGIKKIDSYTLTLDGQDPIACRGYILPYTVTAERTVHFTDGQIAIFAAMPVMIILAILLGVVALVIRSRMD